MQCRDIDKVKGMFRQNEEKLNHEKEEIKNRYIDAIKLLEDNENDTTLNLMYAIKLLEYNGDETSLKLMLNIIDESFPKNKK